VNARKPGKHNPEINNNLSFPKSLVFLSCPQILASLSRRGLSPEATPIFEIGRRKIVVVVELEVPPLPNLMLRQ
jgi:hypothetical protein